MVKTGKLIRTANNIRGASIELRKQRLLETHSQLSKYCERLEELQTESKMLGKSLSRNWLEASVVHSSRIDRLLSDMNYSIQQLKQFTSRDEVKVPALRSLLDELEQLQQEFADVELAEDGNNISVTTEPVVLDGIYLGPFKIQLGLDKLSSLHKNSPYYVIALDPHPAATSEDVTHPHISNERLCEGDGYAAIRAALEQGRLTDFFTMVKGILNTYNPDSPYVNLDDWQGVACYECGYVIGRENCYYCSFCERDFCEECSLYCRSCDETLCLGCTCTCQICDEPVCKRCIRSCSDCGMACCESCLNDNLCPDCKALEDQDNEKENHPKITGENKNNMEKRADPAVQPDCMGQAGILQGQN